MSEPFRICFVCLGNICRSPTAEIVFRTRLTQAGLGNLFEVSSAGTSDWHVGDGMDPRARAALVGAGYDRDEAKAHRAQYFSQLSFRDFDMVVAMDRSNVAELEAIASDIRAREKIRLLRSFDPQSVADDELDVADPYYGAARGFDQVLEVIVRACDGLVNDMAHALGR